MLEVSAPSDRQFLHVTGYADASDWLIELPEERSVGEASFGGNGRYVWVGLYRGVIIYDALERRLIGRLDFPADHGGAQLLGSRDGSRLYQLVLTSGDDKSLVLRVIDPATASLVVEHKGPYLITSGLVEAADGAVLSARKPSLPRPLHNAIGLLRIDPTTGHREDSLIEPGEVSEDHIFRFPSPDGRYWLRYDNRIAREEVRDPPHGFFTRASATPFYSGTVQLWETWPLRFVRWLPISWRNFDELPNNPDRTSITQRSDPAFRQKMWDVIAAASDATPHDPLVSVTPPDLRGPNDKPEMKGTEAAGNWHSLTREINWVAWEPDLSGLWIEQSGFVTRVGLDGTASVSQFARHASTPKVRCDFRAPRPLSRHRLEVTYSRYAHGMMVLHRPPDGPGAPIEVPLTLEPIDRKDVSAQVDAIKAERSRIVVPLAGWSESEVIAAIDRVIADVRTNIRFRAATGHVYPVFIHADRDVGDEEFFTTVTARFPGAAPAIASLLEALLEELKVGFDIYSESYEVGIFGHAARALGLLDPGSLPLLMRYRKNIIDSEHESWFTTKTVPLLIEKHGWSDEMIEFVFWLLLIGNTNGIDSYDLVWDDWGLGAAVMARHSPAAFAELTRRVAGEPTRNDREHSQHTYHAVDQLKRDYAMMRKSETPWLASYFELMKTPEATAVPKT